MTVRHERRGSIAILTIDRPEVRNAVDGPTARAFESALTDAEMDDGVLAIVITGSGDRAFCSGVDLKEFRDRGPAEAVQRVLTEDGFCGLTRRFSPKPVVAAVNGAAIAGGWELALACDLIVASQTAVFGLYEVTRGMVADEGGGVRLPRIVGPFIARELLLTGRPITADRAQLLGLVNRVVPREEVLDSATQLAELVARNAPQAVLATRRLVHAVSGPSDADWEANEVAARATVPTRDALEGSTAYVDKRPPQWVGH